MIVAVVVRLTQETVHFADRESCQTDDAATRVFVTLDEQFVFDLESHAVVDLLNDKFRILRLVHVLVRQSNLGAGNSCAHLTDVNGRLSVRVHGEHALLLVVVQHNAELVLDQVVGEQVRALALEDSSITVELDHIATIEHHTENSEAVQRSVLVFVDESTDRVRLGVSGKVTFEVQEAFGQLAETITIDSICLELLQCQWLTTSNFLNQSE